MSPPAARSLVLSVAVNYDAARLAPFVASCRRHAGDADIVLFVQHMPPASAEELAARGVNVIPADFNAYAGGVGIAKAVYHASTAVAAKAAATIARGASRGAARLTSRLSEAVLHLTSQRYFLYQRFLQTWGSRYDCVLMIDSRDSVFQRSPFPVHGLHVFAENELLGHSHFGRRWYQLSHGGRAWRRHSARPFLCSGVTLGDTTSVRGYLDVICAQMLRVVPTTSGVDQAVHNFIVHEGLVRAQIHAFGDGDAINLNDTPLTALRIEDGRVLNHAGQPFAIVHQYDRVAGLTLRDL